MTIRRLTLTNDTAYETRDIRRIVLAGMAAHGLTECRVIVQNRHGRGNCGRATYGTRGSLTRAARWMKLRLDAPGGFMTTAERLAKTVDHEIYHLRGLRHRQFPAHVGHYIDGAGSHCPWFDAATMLLRLREVKPAPVVTLADRRAKRAEHAEEMHAKALTRLKRAKTIEARWRKRMQNAHFDALARRLKRS